MEHIEVIDFMQTVQVNGITVSVDMCEHVQTCVNKCGHDFGIGFLDVSDTGGSILLRYSAAN